MSGELLAGRLSRGMIRGFFSMLLFGSIALTSSVSSAAQLTLGWVDNSGGTAGFRIERKAGSTGTYAQIATTPAGVTSYIDATVAAGATFCYRVRATNSSGNSGYSNEACGAAPAGLSVTIAKAGSGSGTVVSSPAGISCGSDCTESFAAGTVVTLTASPASGSGFGGWTGGCAGTAPCVVTGNTSVNVTATFLDTTRPTASIGSPANGATVSGTVSVAVTAADNVGVTRVELWVDGALAMTDTAAPWSFAWASGSKPNGTHALVARAYDAAGNVGVSGTVNVTVNNAVADTTAPTVSISSPGNGATVSGTVSVAVTAADNVGVTRVELWVDGALAMTDTAAPWVFAADSRSSPDKWYVIVARAYDAAGNVRTSLPVNVQVRNR
ncbi:MAG TPA: Ig-like domain-containing protein [Candidatus Binatia bacterium]|nr:Ig-like domain-containing protein [Candidatus Binatia bacterium]